MSAAASPFVERLAYGPPVVADGGMGALLTSAVPGLRCPEEANLRAPEAVVAVHVSYINAGAELIETNTFGANRRKLAQHFLEDEFERINAAGVKLAREAREVTGQGRLHRRLDRAARRRRAARSRSRRALRRAGADPRGPRRRPLHGRDVLRPGRARDRGRRRALRLEPADRRADDLRRATRETLAGVSARATRRARLRELDVAAFGANHGAGRPAALRALAEMGGDGAPLAALPNVGLASMSGGRVVFPHATPEYFAEFAAQAGARRADHRRLLRHDAGADRGDPPRDRREPREPRPARSASASTATPGRRRSEPRRARSGCSRDGEFVVSVQLDPPLGGRTPGCSRSRSALKRLGRRAVRRRQRQPARPGADERDHGVGRDRAARGIETIPHLTPRDSTIAGLESLLLGAHAEGVRNILAVTGDPPEAGDYPGAGGVYEVDAIGLVELMTRLNRGEDFHGRAIDAPTSFFPGVAVNPTADDLELEAASASSRKIAAGARFAMTQMLFDLDSLEAFLERSAARRRSRCSSASGRCARHELRVRIHNEVPGIVVPTQVQERSATPAPTRAEVGASSRAS